MFLNTKYDQYLLADSNPDLINLYRQLVKEGDSFIHYCDTLSKPKNNTEPKIDTTNYAKILTALKAFVEELHCLYI